MAAHIRLRVGTRGSPLALAQAHETRRRLASAQGWPDDAIEIVEIRTTGDMIQDRALSEAGGKGLFTKELDRALLDGGIDCAVHSAKDLPTHLPEGLVIAGYLPREDVRDALIASHPGGVMELPNASTIGTASLRRQAQLLRLRPDLVVKLLRGNVGSRLKRVEAGDFTATLLAMAGLNRLGLAHHATAILDLDSFPPAVGQGAIGITARTADGATLDRLAAILDVPTTTALVCERAFLAVLDGSCRTPIAGHARLTGHALSFHGMVLAPDGSEAVEVRLEGAAETPSALGTEAANDLLARGSRRLLSAFASH